MPLAMEDRRRTIRGRVWSSNVALTSCCTGDEAEFHWGDRVRYRNRKSEMLDRSSGPAKRNPIYDEYYAGGLRHRVGGPAIVMEEAFPMVQWWFRGRQWDSLEAWCVMCCDPLQYSSQLPLDVQCEVGKFLESIRQYLPSNY